MLFRIKRKNKKEVGKVIKENRRTFGELFGGTLFYRPSGGRFVKLRAKFKIGTAGPYVNAVRLRDGDLILIGDKEVVMT